MTPMNPLMALMGGPQAEEPDNRRLADFVNGSVVDTPPVKSGPNDNEVLDNTLKGFLSQASQTGEMPTREEFDKRFRSNMSPAREFLANFFTGFSDNMAGRQFRSVKEKAWNQERQVVEERQRTQQQKQQFAMQMANMVQREIESRRDTQQKEQFAQIKQIEDENKQQIELMKFMATNKIDQGKLNVLEGQFKLAQDKAAKDQELKQFEAQDTGNSLFDAARRTVMARLQSQGADLTDAKVQKQMWEETATQWQNLEEVKAKSSAKYSKVGQGPLPYIMPILNPDGQQGIALFDRRSGQSMGGQFIGRKVTPAMLEEVQQVRGAAQSLRTAVSLAQDSKDAVGTFVQMVPPDLRSKLGTMPSDERAIRAFITDGISTYMVSKTGKAATDAERKWLMQGLPQLYEKPENFYPAMAAFTTMFDAAALRTQHGLELDLTPALKKYTDMAKGYIRKNNGSAKGLPIPSADEMVNEAARLQGKVLRKNVWGTLEVANAGQ